MEFWNDTLTQKSWNILLKLQKMRFNFILIGGWATYLWTKKHKSKDIDIIISNFNDLDFLKNNYDLRKNDNLKKYEIMIEEIDIDVYVPYYSELSAPAEDITKHTTIIENIRVVVPEMLILLKQGAEFDRKDSIKGLKDRIDIMALLCYCNIDFKKYKQLLKNYKKNNFLNRLKDIINNFKDIKYLDLTPRQLKLKKKEILDKLAKI